MTADLERRQRAAERIKALAHLRAICADLQAENARLRANARCPLASMDGHQCRSRDWVELEAAGRPGLRVDGDCFEGARYAMTVEANARILADNLADKTQKLLAAVAEWFPDPAGGVDIEVSEAALAVSLYRGAAGLAEELR